MIPPEIAVILRLIIHIFFFKKIVNAPFLYDGEIVSFIDDSSKETKYKKVIDKELKFYLICLSPIWVYFTAIYLLAGLGVILQFFGIPFFIGAGNYVEFLRWAGLPYIFFLGAVVWKVLP